MSEQPEMPDPLGESDAFLAFQEDLSRVAPVERPVLLIGERGTGKELAARRIHFLSKRWGRPLITLNCAALSQSILESELFGHEVGAFTGAVKRRRGRFEMADSGTLFLDEIGQVPMAVQEKILRVVEYGFFERVGGNEPISVDVRIVGATNADLPALVQEGKFKADLLDRLSFEVLHLPPLRVREGDIELLARHFGQRMIQEMGGFGLPEFSASVMKTLSGYTWPGNIRELKNVVERAVVMSAGDVVRDVRLDAFESPWDSKHAVLSESVTQATPHLFGWDIGESSLKDAVENLEKRAIQTALIDANNRQPEAATLLGISYNQFRNLYRKYGFGKA
ncbi:MAG: sigma 54-interacting transcriptional regulator [Verrucomicrobiota bacterium]